MVTECSIRSGNNDTKHDLPFELKYHVNLPSGKLTLWKITMLSLGKSTISMAMFNSFLYVYQAG